MYQYSVTITPAMEERKTEYAERYDVKLLEDLRRFHYSDALAIRVRW